MPAWVPRAVSNSPCSTCQTATFDLPPGARGSRFVVGAGDAGELPINVAISLGSSASRAPARLWAIVDGNAAAAAFSDIPELSAAARWSGTLALPVERLARGSHPLTIAALSDSLDDPYPVWSVEVLKGVSSEMPRPVLADASALEPVPSFASGMFPPETLQDAGLPNRPLSALSTPRALPDANGDVTLRLLFSAVESNCPKPEDRFRILAFLDKEPMVLRGEASLDVLVPKGKQLEMSLSLHGLPTAGKHSLEFWTVPSPDRHVVADVEGDVPNGWYEFTQRHSIVIWNAQASAAREIPARASARACGRMASAR